MNKKILFGYGAASMADSGPYNFVLSYLILFLTTVAAMSPERAGTISSLTILADGVVGVIIGYISDNARTKYGRRRPFILAAVPGLVIGLILLFTVFPFGEGLQTVIYIIAGLLFWLSFSMYYTPYTALGAEITDDYNERSVLRTYARIFGIAGNFIGVVFPLMIVSALTGFGLSEKSSWMTMATILAIVAGGGILITCHTTKGREKVVTDPPSKMNPVGILKEYGRILTLKPFKYLMVVIFAFNIANTFYNSSMVFFARYELGLDDSITSTVFLVTMIANAVYTPITGKCAVKFGKKAVMAFCLGLSGIVALVFFMIGISSYFMMLVYAVFFAVSYSCFWQLINALIYDVSEVGEYLFGKRLEGSISSVFGLMFTFATSLATQCLGWVLKFELTTMAYLLLPAVFLLVAAVAQALYPLNEYRFNKLKDAIVAKNNGESPDLSGLDRII